jgi:UDP-glucose:glycoprotein glucosyltransferase
MDPKWFTTEDFGLLESYEMRKRATPVISALEGMSIVPQNFSRIDYAELVSMASSVVSSVLVPDPSEMGLFNTAPKPRQRTYQRLSRNLT